ncbi:MAG: hypothetical protein OEZ20_03280 [candidate division WOR-3 bacterium]|nr:hypothetical protein [candidate division WOR-3 bacterium]MDH5683468.1 hypothetical protein [candidate division WOR-3 bacterium]
MKKGWLIGILVVSIIGLSTLAYSHGTRRYGMMDNLGIWGGWHRGYMNTGPMPMARMMGYRSYGGQCPMHDMMGHGHYYNRDWSKPLTRSDAKEIGKEYLRYWNNPNLKLGKLNENKNEFEIQIVAKDNSLVQKLLIDKQNRTTRIVY